LWRGGWECVQVCRCLSDRRGDQGRRAARKTSTKSTVTFGDKLGDQLGTPAPTRMARDEHPAAIDERALLDQVDDPDFVQIVS
jgi:hypothetical protein